MSSTEVERLRELTEKLPHFPEAKTEHLNWSEYKVEKGTCFAWYMFERPEVGIHRWYNSRGSMQRHQHPETEIIIVYEGEVKLIFEDNPPEQKEQYLQPGDYVVIPPKTIHHAVFLADTQYITITMPHAEGYPHGSK